MLDGLPLRESDATCVQRPRLLASIAPRRMLDTTLDFDGRYGRGALNVALSGQTVTALKVGEDLVAGSHAIAPVDLARFESPGVVRVYQPEVGGTCPRERTRELSGRQVRQNASWPWQ